MRSYKKIVLLASVIILLLFTSELGPIFEKNKTDLTQNNLCNNCNVILISIDTLGAKHLGIYGYTNRATSPFIDYISKQKGLVFENAISQASWTFPSHTAMLTSKYPSDFGVWEPFDKLPNEAITITEIFKNNGYKTQGFSNGFFVQPEWGFDQGFDGFSGSLDPKNFHDSPKIFTDALSWIENNKNPPFFVFMRPWNINSMGKPSNEALEGIGINAASWQAVKNEEIIAANIRPTGSTKEERERFELEYDAKIREIDSGFEKLYSGLDKLKLLNNTIIIITGDHGEEFGEHGTTRFHTSLYDETTRVPLIILFPKLQPNRLKQVAEIRSIPKTITAALNIYPSINLEGENLLDYLNPDAPEVIAKNATVLDRDWFFRLDENQKTNLEKIRPQIMSIGKTTFPKVRIGDLNKPYSASARSNDWHILKKVNGEYELFHLTEDPEEKNNLFEKWSSLSAQDRREALKVIEALGSAVPVPCGIYCQD